MKDAVIPGYALSKSRHSTKVLVTLAMTGLLLGLMAAAGITISRTGLLPASVQSYYLGQPAASQDVDELDGLMVAAVGRPFDELLEVTHLHLMGGSLMLFMLCHLLSICSISDKTRTVLYLVSFISFISTFGLPWLIIYLHPVFAYGFGPAVLTFMFSLAVLCLVPIREMWFKMPAAADCKVKPLHQPAASKPISPVEAQV